ncbi:MAG: class I SAM-dependent DNA methyltransferase [Chitinophagaceae bacterium]
MQDIKNWIEYYDIKASASDDPLEISDMHLGDDVVNQLFLETEENRMRALLQPGKNRDRGSHLLDLGCSTGICTGLLEKYFTSVTGVDLAEKTVEIAKKRLPGCTFIVDDITQLTKLQDDNNFTHVVSYGVMNFLSDENLVDFFVALARVTRQGTRVVICRVPNKDYYEAYQKFRAKRDLTRQRIIKDQLQWNWISEDFVRKQVEPHFEFIPILPLLQLEFPLRAFFDFVLIRK